MKLFLLPINLIKNVLESFSFIPNWPKERTGIKIPYFGSWSCIGVKVPHFISKLTLLFTNQTSTLKGDSAPKGRFIKIYGNS